MLGGRPKDELVEKVSEAELAGQGANGLSWPSIPRTGTQLGISTLLFYQNCYLLLDPDEIIVE